MSRWPRGIDAAYLKHESDERLKRVLALDVRYGNCAERPTITHIGGSWSPAQHAREAK